MKKLLTERFQELAGIKPLYEQEDDTKKVKGILDTTQEKFSQLLDIAYEFYNGWVKNQTPPSQIETGSHGRSIEADPAWETIKNTLTGKDLFLYFLYKSTIENMNVTSNLQGISNGDINLFIDNVIEEISLQDFDPINLIGYAGVDFVKDLGSGDIKQDRDIIMRLLTTDIIEFYNIYRDLPISAEEMYEILKGGTLDSSSWHVTTSADTQQGINKVDVGVDSTGKSQDRQGNQITRGDNFAISENKIINEIKKLIKRR